MALGLAAALLPAGLHAALPKGELPKEGLSAAPPTLAGLLLIASPRMVDPRFRRSVILMVRHDKAGAFGIAINRPVAEQPVATLLEGADDRELAQAGTVRIFAGGPVQPEIGFVVHTADYDRQETAHVNAEVAVTGNLEVLRDMARGLGPSKAIVVVGYAGWGPGQLDFELARDDWLVAPADPELVFDMPRERVWDAAMARGSANPNE